MSDWKVEPSASHHDRDEFDCGEPSLSEWVRHQIRRSQFEARGHAQFYVLPRGGEPWILGYYSISAGDVRLVFRQRPRKAAAKTSIPAALIGKLAVDQSMRGQGLGGVLLYDALARIRDLAESIGIRAVVVDAIDEHACEFSDTSSSSIFSTSQVVSFFLFRWCRSFTI